MVSAVDGSNASIIEREKAKSILKSISESPLVQTVLGEWFKKLFGSK
jgi:hypothetical protein